MILIGVGLMAALEPQGELAIRTLAMPSDTNPDGHIFGGWIVSQMDLAGLSVASRYATERCVTVAIESMTFISPVKIGDFICCYVSVERIGKTSVSVMIETWAVGVNETQRRQVTSGRFVYVSIDAKGNPLPIVSG